MDKKDILLAPEVLRELARDQVSEEQRLDITYDQLRLVGAVIGIKKLLDIALRGAKDSDRVAASRALIKLREDPQVVAERLRAAPFVDLTVQELEAIVATGILDPKKALKQYKSGEE